MHLLTLESLQRYIELVITTQFLKTFCLGVWLMNHVVIVLGDSEGTQVYIYMYRLSPKLPSYPACHITLSRVPCAIQQDFVGYPFKI